MEKCQYLQASGGAKLIAKREQFAALLVLSPSAKGNLMG
jgi:hypothetical protein